MRTFIALDLPNELIEQVADLSRQLSSMVRARFVARSTYHVTLAFLGEIGEAEARRVMDVLDTACAHAAAIRLVPDGLGVYGKPVDATLLLKLAHGRDLMNLAMAVREGLRAQGVSYDEKRLIRTLRWLGERACFRRRCPIWSFQQKALPAA